MGSVTEGEVEGFELRAAVIAMNPRWNPIMRHLSFFFAVSIATPALFVARPDPLAKHIQQERARLVAHFNSIDSELRSLDVSHLSPEQLTSRAKLITWLRDYRTAGAFPLNDGVAPEKVPIFRDSRGVLCAMAYLIERSGRGDIVESVADTRNTARIHDLVDDARLVAWLDSVGLSVDEAARIQPMYQPTDKGVAGDYALASLVFGGMAMATTTANIVAPSRMSGFMGLLTGGLSMMVGLSRLEGLHSDATQRLAWANTAVGAIAFGAAIRGFTARRPDPARPVTGSRARFDNFRLGPTVTETLGRPQLGVAISARF